MRVVDDAGSYLAHSVVGRVAIWGLRRGSVPVDYLVLFNKVIDRFCAGVICSDEGFGHVKPAAVGPGCKENELAAELVLQ